MTDEHEQRPVSVRLIADVDAYIDAMRRAVERGTDG